MKKKLISGLLACSVLFGTFAFADAGIIPGNVDENNKITFTIKVDKTATSNRNGMLVIYKQEIQESDLYANNISKNRILLTDVLQIPANASEVMYTVNMDGEDSGLYYARVKIGSESGTQAFSYMDKTDLDLFLADVAGITTAEDMYDFFVDHKHELMIDIESEYTSYTEAEKKNALKNVLLRDFTNVMEIKQSFENGLLIVDINKNDADTIKGIVENNTDMFGVDISETSDYSKLDDITAKPAVWADMVGKGFETVEGVKTAFDEAVNKHYVNMLLDAIRNSTEETVMGIFTESAAKALKIDMENGVYATYIYENEKATKKFASLIAGANDWSAENAAVKFKENAIIAAYQTLSDYIKYIGLINMTKTDLQLSGNYFSWDDDTPRYTVNKLMIANATDLTSFDAIKIKFNQFVSQTTYPDTSGPSSPSDSKVTSSSNSHMGAVSIPINPVVNQDNTDLPQTSNVVEFDDLAGYEWAKESIYNLAKHSIVHGTGNSKFEPERLIKKEEFGKMLVEAFEIDVPDASCAFTDVPQSAWYYDYVANLYSAEIIKGIGDSMFGAGAEVSREDMCVMLYNVISYKGYDIPAKNEKINFRDAEHINAYAQEAIEKMQTSGIINGMDGNVFEPKTPTNRAMAAAVIERVLKLLGKI